MQKITLTFIFLFLLTFSAKAQTWQELDSMGSIYLKARKFKEADSVLNRALVLVEQEFGQNDTLYTNVLNQLLESADNQGKYEQAVDYAIQVVSIMEKVLGKEHPYYAASCNNLAALYEIQGLYAKAEPLYVEAKNIREKVLGKEHPNYANSCNNLAALYYYQGLYIKAESLYVEAKNIREKVLGKEHPDYASSCNSLALLYYRQGLYDKAKPLHAEVITNKAQQISTLLPSLSEKERIAYLKSIEFFFSNFQDFTIAYHKENPQVIADLYNQTLFTKSLVFASTQKMREQILGSGDSVLITDFENWKKQKDTYNQLIQKSEKEKSGINLTQLATDINELEKNISKRSTLFAENVQVQRYQWQQIKDKLGKNEVVVEIIRTQRTVGYDSLGNNITETVYIALFVTPKTKNQPDMLVLENGSYLEEELIFYQNAVQFRLEDEESYTTFWKPIAEKLKTLNKKGFSKIYFSPDGVYHQISLNTLQNPKNKQFLLEEQTIQLIGTSRDLIEVGTKETDLSQKFENYKTYLLGYPMYNLDNKDAKQEDKDRSFSIMQSIVGKSVPVLPATKTEIETIDVLFILKLNWF